MKVSQLWIYPIKSCGAIACQEIALTPKGLSWDRELMIVDPQGHFMTQRQYPQMARIRVTLDQPQEVLTLEHDDYSPFSFTPMFTGKEQEVQVWRTHTVAIDQGDRVAQWLQTALGLDHHCRLVRQSPHYPRSINPEYAVSAEDRVSFADGYPLLLTNTASLAELHRRLGIAYPQERFTVPMSRFRPNVVIETMQPFVEDGWQRVRLGEVELAVVKPCARCIVTTIDQTTGQRHPHQEPLKTLATFRQQPGGIMFGQNLIPQTLGSLQVGSLVMP